jgi:hypothetical protein
MNAAHNAGRWLKGQSGNAAGRPRGTGDVAKLREAISAHVPAIVSKLVRQAKAGDVAAARLLLERTVPALKPTEGTIALPLPEGTTLSEQGRAVLCALGSGGLEVGEAVQVLGCLGTLSRLIESDELVDRVAALERGLRGP